MRTPAFRPVAFRPRKKKTPAGTGVNERTRRDQRRRHKKIKTNETAPTAGQPKPTPKRPEQIKTNEAAEATGETNGRAPTSLDIGPIRCAIRRYVYS